jgi:hypothetical protein
LSPHEIEDFEPSPTDMVLFIRDGRPVLRTPTNDGGVIPEDCLLLVAVAASWGDENWREMMLGAVERLAEAGELSSLMTRHSRERPN